VKVLDSGGSGSFSDIIKGFDFVTANAASGASVSITLYRDGSSSGNGTAQAGTDGTVTFKLRNASSGCYTTDVTGVSASGLSFDGSEPANGFCK